MRDKKEKKSSSKKKESDKKKSSEKESDAKRKIVLSNSTLLVILGVLILVLALIFWKDLFPKEEPEVIIPDKVYNGYTFYQVPPYNQWSVVINTPTGNYAAEFYYHPQQVNHLDYDLNITKDVASLLLMKGKFNVGYDTALSNEGIAAVAGSEIGRVTGKIFGIETKFGFTDALDDPAVPVVNCSMAKYNNLVLELRMGDENKIVYEKKCIIIYSETKEDLVKNTDFLAYKLLGVIPSKRVSQNSTPVNLSGINLSEINSGN